MTLDRHRETCERVAAVCILMTPSDSDALAHTPHKPHLDTDGVKHFDSDTCELRERSKTGPLTVGLCRSC